MMIAAPPAALVSLVEPWSEFFGDSNFVQTLVLYAHVGALLVGGGTAIAADRATLRMSSDVDRRRHLLEVSQLHRVVITSLVFIATSGLLMFTADLEAFWGSWIFWTKMVLVVLLLANGARMQQAERAAARETVVTAAHWAAFRGTAITSLVLWLAIAFAGVALINYA
jgi:uncharacterized membrane protein